MNSINKNNIQLIITLFLKHPFIKSAGSPSTILPLLQCVGSIINTVGRETAMSDDFNPQQAIADFENRGNGVNANSNIPSKDTINEKPQTPNKSTRKEKDPNSQKKKKDKKPTSPENKEKRKLEKEKEKEKIAEDQLEKDKIKKEELDLEKNDYKEDAEMDDSTTVINSIFFLFLFSLFFPLLLKLRDKRSKWTFLKIQKNVRANWNLILQSF